MGQPNYNTEHKGFVCRDDGITSQEWFAWATDQDELQRCEPARFRNPFKRDEFVVSPSQNFNLMADGEIIGLLVWEASECIGVAGDWPRLEPFVSRLCKEFRGQFINS